MSLIRIVMLGLVVSGVLHPVVWAQNSATDRVNASDVSVEPSTDQNVVNHNSTVFGKRTHSADAVDEDFKYELMPGEDPNNHLFIPLAKHLASDQRAFWTAPAHFRVKDLEWGVPFAGITAGFIASDSWLSKQIPLGEISRSKTISDYGAYSFIGAGAGAFVLGHLTGNDRMSEAGFLSGEAAVNSTAVAYLFKSITQRPRPYQTNGNGTFFQGGSSFPSEHAAIAWSVASVMAHEYPGTLTKILAYGLATTVSATRVTGQQHFSSDVLIGSALGWYFGRQVYRSHHDTNLGGEAWGDVLPETSGEKTRNPENMGSPYVPLDSWAYPALERLAALGYIKTAYLGIRPWTRLECARMLDEAQQKIADEDDQSGEAARIYSELANEFSSETGRLNGAANVGASLDSVYARATNISGSPLRDGYHFGQTIVNDYGRPYGRGTSFIGGASGSATAGPFAFYVRGEYQQSPSVTPFTNTQLQAMASADLISANAPGFSRFSVNAGSFSRFQLLEGAVSLNLKNIQFSFGRQSVWLGPSETGPFLYSDNAAPITMFKMDTATPFDFPLLSKLFGPARVEFFLGRLSGQQWVNSPPTLYGPFPRDQPFIHGNKISFKPTQNLEFGAGFTAVFAGAGVPFTFRGFLRTYYSHTQLANNPGKRFSAFDFTYRIPGLRDWLTFYMDSLVVDEYSPITSSRASVNPGFYMPQVPKLPHLQLRAEGLREPLTREFAPGFVYIDARYVSGYTNDGYLMGDWVGRAGLGGQGWAIYSFSARSSLQFSYRAQRVSHQFLEGGSLNDFSLKWTQTFRSQLELSAITQYENWRFPLLQFDRQRNFEAMLQLTYWPRLRLHK
jgi:membrane-associated phospholipid phosphatase